MGLLDFLPRLHREQRFHCTCRAGIESDDPILPAGAEEEGHVDWNQQPVPLCIGHLKVGQAQRASTDALVLACGGIVEEECAWIARANYGSSGKLHQVWMLMA